MYFEIRMTFARCDEIFRVSFCDFLFLYLFVNVAFNDIAVMLSYCIMLR